MADERKWADNQFSRYDGIVDGQMQWSFRPADEPVLRFDHTAINAAVTAGAVEIACKNKIVDVAAKGQTVAVADKIAAMREEAARLAAPDATWNRAERPRAPKVDQALEDLIAAVQRHEWTMPDGTKARKSAESARKWLSGMNEAARLTVAEMPRYAGHLADVVKERLAAAKVDVAALEAEADQI